ncbi:MAG: ATP-binding protein [Bacteroidia bacterium]|nr:ATP-binding protein [Bacteroidia bacterium]
MSTEEIHILENEEELVAAIKSSNDSSNAAYTTLRTDERVIARITDGIYRQPSSALRELISNAYDADATKVVIKTDAPRFQRISIEDNGHGMSPESLARMLMHIGGSAKRQEDGKDFNITSDTDASLSPNGRKLIGKIGIGIFSVAQLTHSFQIITKVKNDGYRTIAVVNLKQYTDERVPNEEGDQYESGRVTVWREKASDLDTHGTTIILNNIRPQARGTLQSKGIWDAVRVSEENSEDDSPSILPPKYHVGTLEAREDEMLREVNGMTKSVPYSDEDLPKEAFVKLVEAVWGELNEGNTTPRLDKIFDYYFQMIWNLALSIPVPYVYEHLFDATNENFTELYLVSNKPKESAEKINMMESQRSIRDALNLEEGLTSLNFEVYIDELQILRPIKFKNLSAGGHALKNPLIMLGKCEENFSTFPVELSGGKLKFESYLFWNSKIAPAEHRGVLIRINGASGTLFDSTFLRYQVKELTRLSQITCEIFVQEGLENALNIDRESFNFAHPHAVYLTRWLHNALRQLATTQKKIASEVRNEVRSDTMKQQLGAIEQIVMNTWKKETGDEFSSPPSIKVITDSKPLNLLQDQADIIIKPRVNIIHRTSSMGSQLNTEKIKAIAQILASFGVFEHLDVGQKDRLLEAIYEVIETVN